MLKLLKRLRKPTQILRELSPEEIARDEEEAAQEWERISPIITAANSAIKPILYPLVRDPVVLPTISSIVCAFPIKEFGLPKYGLFCSSYDKWGELLTTFLDQAQVNKDLGTWISWLDHGIGSEGELNRTPITEHLITIQYDIYGWIENDDTQTEDLIVRAQLKS